MLPALLVVALVLVFPLIDLVRFSFLDWSFGRDIATAKWAGFNNYVWLFTSKSSTLFHSMKITFMYVAASLALELLVAMPIAIILNQRIIGRSFIMTALMIPVVLMPVMVALMWRMYLYQNGIVSFLIKSILGAEVNWYTAPWALPAVILVEVWQALPFFILSFLAGLQAVPEEISEAAEVDGASAWQRFYHITLPLLKPVIIVCVIVRTMWLLKAFDVIYVMYTGGPGSATETLGLSIYRALFLSRKIGVSAAISLILVAITLAVTFLFIRVLYRGREEIEG